MVKCYKLAICYYLIALKKRSKLCTDEIDVVVSVTNLQRFYVLENRERLFCLTNGTWNYFLLKSLQNEVALCTGY